MFERIEIKWRDSLADTSGWHVSELDMKNFEKSMEHMTTGYFIRKTGNSIFVCQSYEATTKVGEELDPIVHGILSIPMESVLYVRKLWEKKEKK